MLYGLCSITTRLFGLNEVIQEGLNNNATCSFALKCWIVWLGFKQGCMGNSMFCLVTRVLIFVGCMVYKVVFSMLVNPNGAMFSICSLPSTSYVLKQAW